jgi:Ser/Thr protein kinase RdoA (MazF antagonist)
MTEEIFSKQIKSAQPILRGLQNLKWIVTLSNGEKVFVKQYDPQRYKGKFSHVRKALTIQNSIQQQEVVCPRIQTWNGEPILTTPEGVFFSLMEVCEGNVIQSGLANAKQMASLGYELGKMHVVFQKLVASELHWSPSKEHIQAEWEQQYSQAKEGACSSRILFALEKQREILDHLDFTQFRSCHQGWAHWDLYFDNLLFQADTLSAILDFDRMRYVYPELDVARATLSGCVDVTGLDEGKLFAFLKGYQAWIPTFLLQDLGRALQLLWTVEAPWWMKTDIEECSVVPQRFFLEIEWLQQNWGIFT